MTTATITILKDVDKNYDKLFKVIDGGSMFGRTNSLGEKQTAAGYEVTLPYLSQEVQDFIAARPKAFRLS